MAKREGARVRQQECRARKKSKENSDRVTPVTRDTCDMPRADIKNAYAHALIPVGISNDIPPKDKKTNKKDLVASILSDRADFFDRLWAVMPKRRGDAPKPFKEAVAKKLAAGIPAEKIEAGVVAYAAAEKGRDGEYRAMAVTWINQERWDADWSQPPPAPAKKPVRHLC